LLRSLHWHPVLLAIYPVLALLSHNIASVRPRAAWGPMAVAAVAGLVLAAVCSAALRHRGRGALLASMFWVVFFGFGHVLGLVGGGRVAGWILLAAAVGILAVVTWLLARWNHEAVRLNRILDASSIALVVAAMIPIVGSELRPATHLPDDGDNFAVATPLGYLPDIYVIVLDAFGRADILQANFGVDLTGLRSHLEGRGFVIADQARANYNQTTLSLAVLLNHDYLPTLLPGRKLNSRDKVALTGLVRSNRVVRRLRDLGYRLVTLTGGSELAVQADPDVNYRGGALNEFEAGLLALTPLPLVSDLFSGGSGSALDPFAQHRESVKFQLGKLPHVTAPDGPKFVFAHVLTPHPPFVIGPDGEDRTPNYEFSLQERRAWQGYEEGYGGQATWLAGELKKTVDGILAASRRPPVILVMGDHGPASKWIASWRATDSFLTTDPAVLDERMGIFLALLMPDGEGGVVYPELSPVNVFPLVFERLFAEPFDPLEDRSYFSTYEDWAAMRDVDLLKARHRP
jgi:hypothetical protein